MKKLFSLIVMALMTMGAFAETWTVAGVAAIVNGDNSWNASEAANDMTLGDDGLYTLKVEDCILGKGTNYEYKVVKDHSWNEAYPSQNKTFTVAEDGKYDVVFTFNPTTKEVSEATTKKAGDVVIPDKTWTVAGDSQVLFGAAWAPEEAANDMVKNDNGIFEKAYEDVTLSAGNIMYKIVANHGWDEAYPSQNATLNIPEDAKYDVLFTFNADTKAVEATATKKEEVVIEHTYTVAGQFDEDGLLIFGAAWVLPSLPMTWRSRPMAPIRRSTLLLTSIPTMNLKPATSSSRL